MTDPLESKLQRTRQRSIVSSSYDFEFMGNFVDTVFPIFQRTKAGKVRLIGTGFFVVPGGIFATARHVFEGLDINEDDCFEIAQQSGDHLERRDITHICFSDNDLDIAVCKLEPAHDGCAACTNHPVVSTMRSDPILHEGKVEVVASYVFAQTLVHEPVADPTGEYDGDDTQLINWRAHWEKGQVEEIHPDGLRKTKGRCFTTSIFVEGRASGGPVFNSSGFVVGINSTGFAALDGLPYSTISSISSLLDMKIDGVTVAEMREGVQTHL